MKVVETILHDSDDLGYFIDLECYIYEDKSYKYVVKKEFYKYDIPEFEEESFKTYDEAKKYFDDCIKEYEGEDF